MIRFLMQLKQCQDMLTSQQYKTLKGQALAGDVLGAQQGLTKLINR